MEIKTVEEINQYIGTTVNPLDNPDTVYELYSVPSFESQHPEIIKGEDIGSSKITVEDGDVLVCKINPRINRVWVVKWHTSYPLLASSEWIVIRNCDIDSDYLKWYFSSPTFRNLLVSQVAGIGGSLTRAQPKQVAKYPVPLVGKEEQRRIAALLDKVSDLIAKRRAQLDKLDLLVKAQFVEMFGDLAAPECPHKKCKLVETCVSSDDIKCGPFGTQLSKEEYQDHGVAVWEIPQINSYFTTQPTHFLTAEKAEQLKAYSIIPGDIAMSRKGNVGRCALFPDNFDSGIIHSDVLRIRVDKQQVNPCFMMYQLHFSGAVQRQIEVVSSGAIMAGVNVTKLKHIEIHLPDFDLQQQFAHFVGEVDRVKYSINNSLEKLETLKKALIQQYFGGGGNVENC